MAGKWTDEQKKVFMTRGRNLLVSAAAGSGKTAVLIERILRIISEGEHPYDVDSLLVVTFTRAAAEEMKGRLGRALAEKVTLEPDNEHLKRQLVLLNNARIMTIDKFCLEVVRGYFHLIDLDPSFRVADENELAMLKRDCLDELLEELYMNGSESFLRLVESYSGKNSDEKIGELVLKLYGEADSFADPEEWLGRIASDLRAKDENDLNGKEWMKYIFSHVEKLLTDCIARYEEGIRLAMTDEGIASYIPVFEQEKAFAARLLEANGDYTRVRELAASASFDTLPRAKKGYDPVIKDAAKSCRDDNKDILKKNVAQFFLLPAGDVISDLNKTATVFETLIDTVRMFSEKFAAAKRKRNVVDFGDIEHFALRILAEKKDGKYAPLPPALELRRSLCEIMCDEYQDSNDLQDKIFHVIAGEPGNLPNLFMVGDIKQSIYRFRKARPSIFNEKYKSFACEMDDSDGLSINRRIDLGKNFRSRGVVLEAINSVFEKIMTEAVGDVSYDGRARLCPGRGDAWTVVPSCESCLLEKAELILVDPASDGGESEETEEIILTGDETEDEASEKSARELEAAAIAKRIGELTDKKNGMLIPDGKGGFRPLCYSDIVILLRSVRAKSDVYVNKLMERGIPCAAVSKSGFFNTYEVRIILDLLRVIDNEKQDIPFAGVLYSPICGFKAEQLALIRIAGGGKRHLSDMARAYVENDSEDAEVKKKLAAFFELIDDLRKIRPYLSVAELLREIYNRTGFFAYASCMPAGKQRRANLEMLSSLAVSFEETSYSGLFSFLRYVERITEYDCDYGEASVENGNVVRVMTVHGSKGLEYPVVFLADSASRYNTMDASGSVLIHPELGISGDRIDLEKRTKRETLFKKAISCRINNDERGEQLRVLYVALTRAREKLIIVGTAKNSDRKLDEWSKVCIEAGDSPLSYGRLVRINNYLDLIAPFAINNKYFDVKVLRPEELRLTGCIGNGNSEEKKNGNEAPLSDDYLRSLKEARDYTYVGRDENIPVKVSVSFIKKKSMLEEDAMFEVTDVSKEPVGEEAPGVVTQAETSSGGTKQTETSSGGTKQTETSSGGTKQTETPSGGMAKAQTPSGGALRGTLYHRVLAILDFTRVTDEKTLEEGLAELVKRSIITTDECDMIDKNKFAKFFESPIAARMRKAAANGKMKVEQPFVMQIEASRVDESYPDTEKVLVQGIIDVFFEEEGGIVLLDYKTDRVPENDRGLLIRRYKAQLELYAEAIERILSKKVKEKLIYSFCFGETMSVE